MPLTPDERKERLGHGGLRKLAKRLRVTEGHVSQVNRRKRPDARVERAITRDILKRHPELSEADVWPSASQESPATVVQAASA